MIVQFLKKFTDNHQTYEHGFDYDVPNEDAKRFLDAGVARKSPEPVSVVREQPPVASPLKPGEHVVDAPPAADVTKPAATPVEPAKDADKSTVAVEPEASKASAKAK